MKHVTVAVVVSVLVGVAAVALAGSTRPAFHEEAGRVLGEVTDQIRNFRAQIERHFYGSPGWIGPGDLPPSPAERPLISFMLEHRGELGLTDEQARRLETLRSDFAREAIRREAEIRIAEMDLAALLEQDLLDMPRVEAKVREAAQLRADLRLARLRTIEQGKATLTPEQRTRLQSLLTGPRPPRRAAGPATRL